MPPENKIGRRSPQIHADKPKKKMQDCKIRETATGSNRGDNKSILQERPLHITISEEEICMICNLYIWVLEFVIYDD